MDSKVKLGNAIHDLLEEKELDKITREEILQKAGVSEAEFEKYFHSNVELAHWEYLHILSLHGKEILGASCWSEALYRKSLVYDLHLKFLQNLYKSKDVEAIRVTNRRFVRDAYNMMLRKAGADLDNPHIQFAVEMVVVGGEEITMRWVMEGMKVPIEVMLVLFQESIPLCISQYFY